HGIEHLLHHLALGETAGRLDQPVGQRRLAVVDMRDDGEVADIFDGRVHGARISTRVWRRQAGGLDDSWRLASPRNRGASLIPRPPPAAPPGMARARPAPPPAPRPPGPRATIAWPGGTGFQCGGLASSGSDTTTTLPPDSR